MSRKSRTWISKQASDTIDTSEYDKINQERIRLQEELAQAKWAITPEELQQAQTEAAKTETQKLIDQKIALAAQKKDLEEKVLFEKNLQN